MKMNGKTIVERVSEAGHGAVGSISGMNAALDCALAKRGILGISYRGRRHGNETPQKAVKRVVNARRRVMPVGAERRGEPGSKGEPPLPPRMEKQAAPASLPEPGAGQQALSPVPP